MENSINCFQLKSHLTDLLISTTDLENLENYTNHLQNCRSCETLVLHQKTILSILENQPVSTLPQALRDAPFSAVLPRITSMPFSISRWQRIPWYFRILLESSLIIAGVITLVSSTPRLRELYENHIEKNLENLENTAPTLDDLSLQEREITQNPDLAPQELTESGAPDSELNGEEETSSSHAPLAGSQLWRFTLKTVSPDELRVEILKVLNKFDIPAKTAGSLGVQVPGGIEFNFLLPADQINELKRQLQNLTSNAEHPSESPKKGAGSEDFTWYRVNSKKKLPSGKAQVIIWISQPHA